MRLAIAVVVAAAIFAAVFSFIFWEAAKFGYEHNRSSYYEETINQQRLAATLTGAASLLFILRRAAFARFANDFYFWTIGDCYWSVAEPRDTGGSRDSWHRSCIRRSFASWECRDLCIGHVADLYCAFFSNIDWRGYTLVHRVKVESLARMTMAKGFLHRRYLINEAASGC